MLALLGAICALSICNVARADVPQPLDRVSIWLGAYYPTVDASIRADGPGVAGTDVRLPQDLGLDNHRTMARLRADVLVYDTQGFTFDAYQYTRHAAASAHRELEFDGNDYSASAFVAARLKLDFYSATWHWWLGAGDIDVIGVGIGAAYYSIKGILDGGITLNDYVVQGHGEAEADAIAPLATFGWRHAFSDRARLYMDFSGVRKAGGTFTGHILNAQAGVEYFVWQNLGLALEYDASQIDVKADKSSWEGRARIRLHGPALFARLRF